MIPHLHPEDVLFLAGIAAVCVASVVVFVWLLRSAPSLRAYDDPLPERRTPEPRTVRTLRAHDPEGAY